MKEEQKVPMGALDDKELDAVTGGDANYTYPCPQCGQIAWEYVSSHISPTFTGRPTPRYVDEYRCGHCRKLKQQGLVDEVPTLNV